MRLSYHDIKLFLRIFESAKKQIDKAIEKPSDVATGQDKPLVIKDKPKEQDILVTQRPVVTDEVVDIDGTAVAVKDPSSAVVAEEKKGFSLAGFEVELNQIHIVFSLLFCLAIPTPRHPTTITPSWKIGF